jgi:phage replication-related protein YjqB (UPF0714/DUF867 family)
MHIDRYRNYAELAESESMGTDFNVTVLPREFSSIAIVAPHGGMIEPRTAEVARQIAGENFNLYIFEGIKPRGNYAALHITSHHFDDPSCLALLSTCETVVAIHGCAGTEECVMLGGLDTSLRNRISDALQAEGIQVNADNHIFQATDKNNICNRGRAHKGVQLELTHGLRRSGSEVRVVSAVRGVLLATQHGS